MKNLNYNLVLFFLFILNNVLAQNIFFNPPTLVNSSSLAKVRDLDIGDINGDGKPDLLFASSQNNSIYLVKNDNSQSNHFDSLITITNNFYRASIVKIKDIDNDGDLDFIAAGFRQENISWFENISNGNKFSQHYIFNLTDGISSIALFDADQDGDNDLIISYWEGSKISLFEYIDGEFKDEKTIDSSAGIIAQIDNKDIDGDGLEDIVAIQLEKNKIVYYKNTPDSTRFSIMTELINTLDRPSDFAIGDVDKDGDDDLIVASRNKVFSFKNENGIFGEEQEIFNKNYSIEDIFIVDLDNDDDNDIILGNSEAGSVLSFINLDGNGNFSDGYTILNSF
ncbi:MAG TPA: VCBS repeat-containing protein, partial [Bacteroidetes bacterium]|nr:VCBS repeat-containing protein [Bacteroidota bacterium]